MLYYRAFGLNIRSEIHTPMIVGEQYDVIDVDIQLGKVRDYLDSEEYAANWCQANEQQLLLKVKDVAKFLIENGNRITIELLTEDVDYVNVYLLGSALGAILHQRGYLVMHANGIAINNKAVLVMAAQGHGKSTLAAAFLKKGYSLLSDDVCAIAIQNNEAVVYPGYPQIKLCSDMLQPLGYDANKLKPIPDIDKYYVPIHNAFQNSPLPLSHFIFLERASVDAFIWKDLTGQDKFKAILENTYRSLFIDFQNKTDDYFQRCSKLINNFRVNKLVRPQQGFSAFSLVDEIVQTGV